MSEIPQHTEAVRNLKETRGIGLRDTFDEDGNPVPTIDGKLVRVSPLFEYEPEEEQTEYGYAPSVKLGGRLIFYKEVDSAEEKRIGNHLPPFKKLSEAKKIEEMSDGSYRITTVDSVYILSGTLWTTKEDIQNATQQQVMGVIGKIRQILPKWVSKK